MLVKDGLVFVDNDSNEEVVFNYYTFREIIVGILMQYAGETEAHARKLVESFSYFDKPIETYSDVVFFSRETEYHWAMLIKHGDGYWLKGISPDLPEDYYEWEDKFIVENNLSKSSFEFDE